MSTADVRAIRPHAYARWHRWRPETLSPTGRGVNTVCGQWVDSGMALSVPLASTAPIHRCRRCWPPS